MGFGAMPQLPTISVHLKECPKSAWHESLFIKIRYVIVQICRNQITEPPWFGEGSRFNYVVAPNIRVDPSWSRYEYIWALPCPVATPLILIHQFISFTMINEHEVTKRYVTDGEGLSGEALENRWCLSLSLKAGRVEMDERWHGSLFQLYEAIDENV